MPVLVHLLQSVQDLVRGSILRLHSRLGQVYLIYCRMNIVFDEPLRYPIALGQ